MNKNIFITSDNQNLGEIQEIMENNNNDISQIKAKNNSSIKYNNSVSTNEYSRFNQINNTTNESKQVNTYSKTIKVLI